MRLINQDYFKSYLGQYRLRHNFVVTVETLTFRKISDQMLFRTFIILMDTAACISTVDDSSWKITYAACFWRTIKALINHHFTSVAWRHTRPFNHYITMIWNRTKPCKQYEVNSRMKRWSKVPCRRACFHAHISGCSYLPLFIDTGLQPTV